MNQTHTTCTFQNVCRLNVEQRKGVIKFAGFFASCTIKWVWQNHVDHFYAKRCHVVSIKKVKPLDIGFSANVVYFISTLPFSSSDLVV